ncbi:acyl carrier protein [Thalassobium sp. R2A62]|jgi:acyl carrier protein|uniref:acyl carrier protein n=1 Tax=Thalassobium sp. R2A62 TaxID=633131 RepID=UPI0001B1D728|nr:acyl carrier protein [Thalassobium sp. R2A62]EET49677.1 phosphopantetheine-binding [Thalassobium sp. R2A62]MDG1339163.1 acyl carrier protein [Paracoccaceae bacterium]MDG1803275.1 acyl carrier protein [Paracoccaceae bacterium]MDG2451391.1 acyl carrier protein [Paracoccaceae bacterium]
MANVDTTKTMIAILAEQAVLEPTDVALTDTLDALGIDSMGLVEVIFSIEEAFEISVPFNANAPEDSPFDISTVATMIAAVDQLRRAQG